MPSCIFIVPHARRPRAMGSRVERDNADRKTVCCRFLLSSCFVCPLLRSRATTLYCPYVHSYGVHAQPTAVFVLEVSSEPVSDVITRALFFNSYWGKTPSCTPYIDPCASLAAPDVVCKCCPFPGRLTPVGPTQIRLRGD